mmetsp:Transcript_32205/g.84443  ORF Transcript_32205/g.84443 Transcript_32205/m.84443 type:complete len:348 (-) Transcript_32205:235-1278(-)
MEAKLGHHQGVDAYASAKLSPSSSASPLLGRSVVEYLLLLGLLLFAHRSDMVHTATNGHMLVASSMAVGICAILLARHFASIASIATLLLSSLPCVVSMALCLTELKVPVMDAQGLVRLTISWAMVTAGHGLVCGHAREMSFGELLFLVGHLALIPHVEAPEDVDEGLKSAGLLSALIFGGCARWSISFISWIQHYFDPHAELRAFEAEADMHFHELEPSDKERPADLGKGLTVKDPRELATTRELLEDVRVTCNASLQKCDILERQRNLLARFVELDVPRSTWPHLVTALLHRITIECDAENNSKSDSEDDSPPSHDSAAMPERMAAAEQSHRQVLRRPGKSPVRR